jgi:SAM-dependent methyltransferase
LPTRAVIVIRGVHVEVGCAEALPFANDAFDHALAQLVVNFMADPPAGVAEMQRATRSGGTVTAAVWDAAVAIDPSAADRDEGRCMPYCTPHELGGLLATRGLTDVEVIPATSPPAMTASRISGTRWSWASLLPARTPPRCRPCAAPR